MNLFETNKKVHINFTGMDSNIFYLEGMWAKHARMQGWSQEDIEKVLNHVNQQKNYNAAVKALLDHSKKD